MKSIQSIIGAFRVVLTKTTKLVNTVTILCKTAQHHNSGTEIQETFHNLIIQIRRIILFDEPLTFK